MNNLPPDDPERLAMARPWRQRAWEQVPGWARIALAAIVVLIMINIGLVIRIWYGLQDPPEVAAIKGPGRHIIIPGTNQDFRNPLGWLDAAPIGLRGVSAKDVTAVRLDGQATDELVAYIAQHFPNVQALYFSGGNITTNGLLALKNCSHISSLDVSDTDVGDGLAELLPHLPKLTTLIAMNTNLSDRFAKAAAQHDTLEYCPIEGTDITPEGAAAWSEARPATRIQTDFDRVALRAVIRWSDGQTSHSFRGPYELGRYGPRLPNDSQGWARSTTSSSTGMRGENLRWSRQEFKNEPNGNYQIRLKLSGIESTPADFVVKDGQPSPDRIELQMPVTRAEAERQAKPNRTAGTP